MSPWILIAIGFTAMSAVMTLLWLGQRRGLLDSGIVDVAWGMGVAGLGVFYAVLSVGDITRRIVVSVMISIWAIRLSGYVLKRVLTMEEDGRYATLKEKWGDRAQSKLFAFYQMQSFGSVLFSIPILLAARNELPVGWLDGVGVAIWLTAILGESIADMQLHRFRINPANKGKVCRDGLWGYSRHPNYFFEWLHWWSYVCLALGASFGWLTIIGPLAMLHFILNVTGIPPTEAQSLKSRGDAYRSYQKSVSPFFPWFPTKMPLASSSSQNS